MDRWRWYVVGYLVWLILFTVVEGTGREVCRMPTARWIAAGVDGRDRVAREWFRDSARACLDRTRWYEYSMTGLVAVGLVSAVAAIWVVRRRGVLIHGVALLGVLGVMLATISGVRWMYDWMA
jgi:hypothetical protein